MSWKSCFVGAALYSVVTVAGAQSAPSNQMTLDEFSHYLDVLHIREADARGAKASMKAQDAQLSPWWPSAVSDEMLQRELRVDFAAINYGYVKGCVSSQDIDALTAMFATPEGQQYAARMMGTIVEKEGQGVSATTAREAEVDHDTGLPSGAMQRLTPVQREQVKHMIAGGAMDCMNSGYKKANADIAEARGKAARAVVSEHRSELLAAKQKYETTHPASSK